MMLIDKLGSKVKGHVYIVTEDVNGSIQVICENEQIAKDIIAHSPITMTMKVWAVWGYRGDYTPLAAPDKVEKVNYNG
jgi:hypothetical protein